MKLYVFPGAHKTGTTLLQGMLETHREVLEENGYAIARRQRFYNSGMREALYREDGFSRLDASAREEILKSVFGVSVEARNVILSVENAFGEPNYPAYNHASNALRNLRHFFPNHEMTVVFYIRRQDTFLESLFVQNTQYGEIEDIDTFVNRMMPEPLDWMRVLAPVFEQVDQGNISIKVYETLAENPRRYVRKFFSVFSSMSPDAVLSTYDGLENTNISLSEFGLQIAQAGYAAVPDRPSRRKLASALKRDFSIRSYPRFRLPDRIRERIVTQHRACNEDLIASGFVPAKFHAHYRFKA